jgi:mRNA-degrading endonuclease HigB of HigAB toxin-antitoxin module
VGTAEWWKRKYGDKFDNNEYYLLEVMSRKEYDKVDLQEAMEEYQQHLRLQQKLIEKELREQGVYDRENYLKVLNELKSYFSVLNREIVYGDLQ